MTPRRVSPLAAAFMLSAIIGIAGQPDPSVDRGTQTAVKESQQQTESTKTPAPTNAPFQRQVAGVKGGGPDPRSARNVKRQARRVLEKIGVVTSGRQWRLFRKLARSNKQYAELWQLALHVAKNRIPV